MIWIKRSQPPPVILTVEGAKASAKHCAGFDAGQREFTFRDDIYGHQDVRARLKDDQHLKCCFCERLVGEDGHVEHFRPKAATRQASGEPLAKPGYYWLAYEWSNLMLCCADCNTRHKANLFPLSDPTKRACSHYQDCASEDPLFLNPSERDPELDIHWEAEIPRPRGGDMHAAATISALGLDRRDGLLEARRRRLSAVVCLCEVLQVFRRQPDLPNSDALVAKIEGKLQSYTAPTGEFAAMVRAYLATL